MGNVGLLLILVVVFSLIFDYINGFHDTANAIATVVSTRVLTPIQAILMAAVLNFGGALIATRVAQTIASGIITTPAATELVILGLLIATNSILTAAETAIVSARRAQLARLAEHGLTAFAATELEFILFRTSYEDAWNSAYRNLVPANQYNCDYSMLGTARVEPVIRNIRNAMEAAGIQVENSKGECNLGQHEINFRYGEALQAADGHVIYKEAAKEIAAQAGHALTFMAKFNEREGNSCHTHLSLRDLEGRAVFVEPGTRYHSLVFQQFLAGLLAHAEELAFFFAPNINSYKRYAAGSFAPTGLVWGHDNRTCAFRVLGHGKSLRVENRLPGGDVNPYLALAAMIAAGLDGVDKEMKPVPAFEGNAYLGKLKRVPKTLAGAAKIFAGSSFNKAAFGEDVVAHYANMAQVELDAFNTAVTDWERYRSFERM